MEGGNTSQLLHEYNESSPTDASDSFRRHRQNSGRKFRSLTCANCRAKKVRCEGGLPSCKTCEIYGSECRYDKLPPMSQILSMVRQLRDAEKTISELRRTPTEPNLSPTHGTRPVLPTKSLANINTEALALQMGMQSDADFPGATVSTRLDPPTNLRLDDQGGIRYYGPTSAVHDPAESASPSSHISTSEAISKPSNTQSFLASNAVESGIWEEYALANVALRTGLPRRILGKLLHLHWTWVAPMFMWVYRPAFLRDMTTGARYYSEFLLTVLCAHAAKYQDDQYVGLLNARLQALLPDAILGPSSIPTVQAFLQLSARELANGSLSRAWLYSGIAFRMADDLVLHHDTLDLSNVKGISPVDLEVRRRLSWSCYFWDKAISLYTGRLPVVTEVPPYDTSDFADDPLDLQPWSPCYEDSLSLSKITAHQFPPMKSHAVSCFANSCKLSIIMSSVIHKLYSRHHQPAAESVLISIRQSLEEWRARSPKELRYDPAEGLPNISPPPHIISQNLLYYTTLILAHRPFWSLSTHYKTCISAAKAIERLLLLFETTFGFENITYLMGYCIYTGASAMLELANKGDVEANSTMRLFMRSLNSGTKRCLLLQHSLEIIVKGMSPTDGRNNAMMESAATGHYIPAFPYFDLSGENVTDMDGILGNAGMSGLSFLECYPEAQQDISGLISTLV